MIAVARRNGKSSLDLSGMKLATLPESVGQLKALKRLFLSNNQLTTLPESVGQLKALRELYLSKNQLTTLPESLGQLTALRVLNLDYNQLTVLPESLGQLTSLLQLDLFNNQLIALPRSLWQLRVLESLDLIENDALGLPREVIARSFSPSKILDYYFKTREQARPLNEVKLLLVGRGGAGKTSVIRRLRENKFVKGSRETLGIAIKPWLVDAGERRVKVHTWDFAGQVMTHATHTLFFSARSVYVLVLTGRENTEQTDAEYWLRLIRAFATDRLDDYVDRLMTSSNVGIVGISSRSRAVHELGHILVEKRAVAASNEGEKSFQWYPVLTAPVIVALNKCKAHPCRLDHEKLREKYPFITAFVETDCAKGTGIRELKRLVLDAIAGVMKQQQNFPSPWFRIKDAIKNDPRDYLTYDEFGELCKQHGEPDPAQQRLLAWALHQLGIALNYGDDERLRDTTVLDPHWVTGGIYKLLRQAKDRRHPEEMSLDAVARVLPKEDPKMRRYLVELMRRYDLAFPMGDDDQRWLVPQRLPEGQPRLEEKWFGREVTRVRFRYIALPEGLLPRFITRTYPLSEDRSRWVHGVVLADAGAEVLVRADVQEREVSVVGWGPEPARRELTALACNELRRIHADYKGLDPIEEIEPEATPGRSVPRGDVARRRAHAPHDGGADPRGERRGFHDRRARSHLDARGARYDPAQTAAFHQLFATRCAAAR